MDKFSFLQITSNQSCLHSFFSCKDTSELHLSNSPSKLAEAGFERTPESKSANSISDEVQCRMCGVKYSGWDGERPLAVHRTLSPKCSFLNTPPSSLKSNLSTTEKENHKNAITNVRRQLFPEYDLLASKIEDYPEIQHPFVPKRGDFLMLFESFRILTFQDPTSAEAAVFAKCGFVFDANSINAACIFCDKELAFKNMTLVELEFLHAEKSPRCPFVKEYDVGNVSREEETSIKEKAQKKMYMKSSNETFIVKHPEYEDNECRVGTFSTWPVMLAMEFSNVIMAECGFYYTGFRDSVKCFCCGVGLRNWTKGADPCSQHAKASPDCYFIQRLKGNEFVDVAKRVELTVQIDCKTESNKDSSHHSDSQVGSPHLDLDTLKAAKCQYTIQKIANAVRNFFVLSNGRYPNGDLLIGTLKAADMSYTQVCQQRQEIIVKDSVIQAKDKEIVQTKNELKQKNSALRTTQTELSKAKDTLEWRNNVMRTEVRTELEQLHREALQQKDEVIVQKDEVIEQKDEVIEQKDEVIEQNREVIEQNREVIEQNREVIEQKDLIIELKNREVEDLQRHIQSLMAAMNTTTTTQIQSVEPEKSVTNYDTVKDEEFPIASCKVCLNSKAQIVFLPCKHLCCCDSCATRLYGKSCPICRETNLAMEKVYVI